MRQLLIFTLFTALSAYASGPQIYYGAFSDHLESFEMDAGKKVSIINSFKAWGGQWAAFSPSTMTNIRKSGSIPMITWEPWKAGSGVQQDLYSLKNIALGKHDAYIKKFASDAKAWGHPFFLRFAHEMNGNWYPWCERVNGNENGSYVKAWKHVREIFKQVGATNITWVWVPNINYNGSTPLSQLYPGHDLVDWVGMDAYNSKPSRFRSFRELVKPTYEELLKLAPKKPIMIAETSSVEAGGSKAQWIKETLERLPVDFPEIKALVWFNVNKESDWRIESSSSAQAAFARGIASKNYSSNTFSELKTSPIPPLKPYMGPMLELKAVESLK